MFQIKIDPYRKQTNADFRRVWELLELQAEWDAEDLNAAHDRIGELEKELRRREETICKLSRESCRSKGGK